MVEPNPLRTAPGGQRGVVEAACAQRARGERFALALVVETSGSTYRKAGALAMVGADGTRVGALSGGCLEPEIERRAAQVIATGTAQFVELDTRSDDDLLFGSGSGCRGRLHVLVAPGEHAAVAALLAAMTARQGLLLQCTLAASPPELSVVDAATAPSADCRRVAVEPPPHVLLFGAGPETPALTRILRELGWYSSVADHRPALADPRRLPAADRVLAWRPRVALTTLDDEGIDAAIVMSHSASIDLEALELLAAGEVGYVDLLGPRARRDELLAAMSADARARLQPRLHGPAGLDLGGEGPEAIALAIAAGLQRHLAGR